jgi:ubiquinone/menaquinone biosynthesis C-methylase UbiE
MMADEAQKQLAVDTHSEQSELFASRYEGIQADPYHDCFVYSRHRLDLLLDKFLPAWGEGLRMLDLGCGTGYHLNRYRERGYELAGVDGSEEMLRQARLLNPEIEFKQADVEQIPFPDASFDLVMSIEVLRYLPDLGPSLREIARVLKPGGTALVTAAPPLQANLYPPVNRLASAFRVGDLTKLKQYFHSPARLRREFAGAGFSATEVHGVYGGPMIWVERVLPAAMPRLLRVWEKVDAKTANARVLRSFSNMVLVVGKKGLSS